MYLLLDMLYTIVILTKKVFLNITLGEALEEQKNGDKLNIGTIVSIFQENLRISSGKDREDTNKYRS